MISKNYNKRHLGNNAEELVCEYFRQKNYKIIDRNCYIHRFGELDIIARELKTRTIVFVEVRSSAEEFVHPSQMITEVKHRRLQLMARLWLLKNKMSEYQVKWRIDLIVVHGDNINSWFKNI